MHIAAEWANPQYLANDLNLDLEGPFIHKQNIYS